MSLLSTDRNSARGFTLIEIMIALLIGIFLIAGVIQLFINSKQTYRMQEALARLQENGRFALDFLDHDIRMSGFQGCASRGTADIKNHLGNSNSYIYNYKNAVEGFDAGTSTWSPALPNAISTIVTPTKATDVITIRRAADDGVQITDSSVTTLRRFTLNRNTIPALKSCDVVMVSDCANVSVFQISSYDNVNKYAYGIDGACSTTPPGGNARPLDWAFANGSLNKMVTTSYFIKNNASGEPALFRIVNSDSEEELVEGVQDMQIVYGQDTDGDYAADTYTKADVANVAKIVSVRISLLLRTVENNIASKPIQYSFNGGTNIDPGDRRIRRVFTSTIGIRNKLP